jgi:hypothetical protein
MGKLLFFAGKPRLDWARRANWARAGAPRAYARRVGDFFEHDRCIKAYRYGVAERDDVCVHPALAINFIDDHKDHSGRYSNASFNQRLEHTFNWLANSFISLAIMSHAKNKNLFMIVGIVSDNNPAKFEFFASGLRLNATARKGVG